MNTPKLMTVKQVAGVFKVCQMTVRRWEASGDLRSVRIGRSIRFTQESLHEFVTAHDSARDREMDKEMTR